MENKARLVEMSETDNGYSIKNLSPFFIHTHIHELQEKAKAGLVIYRDLQRIATIENTDKIISIISSAMSVDEAKKELMAQFSINESTADYIVESPIEELGLFGAFSYEKSIEIYEEAVKSFTRLYDMQVALENIGETEEE